MTDLRACVRKCLYYVERSLTAV